MKVPFGDLSRQYKKYKKEFDSIISGVFEKGSFILGENLKSFEDNFARYLEANHAIGVANGTEALFLALKAFEIGNGDEVITVSNTAVPTISAIDAAGAKPVFVDIEENTFNIDPSKIERVITSKTKAIIPVHLYGQAADMDPIMRIAGKHGLKVIEDAAQAMGASYRGRKVGSLGDVACISFFPSKNLGSFGDAGMVVSSDSALAERMRMIVLHGSKERYHHEILGVNSRLDTLQASILRVKLRYLDAWNAARRRFAAQYNELLKGVPVTAPYVSPECEHIFHQYTLRAPRRDELGEFLKNKGIPHGIYYPIPLYRQKAYASRVSQESEFPVTEQAAREVLSLPMHTELDEQQLAFITDSLREFYAST